MPKLTWNKQGIQTQWRPVDFQSPVALSAIENEYCNFYKLDFENRIKDLEHGFGYFESADQRLAAHYYRPRLTPSIGTILIVHGYFDHAGLCHHLIEFCLKLDYSVVVYDLPGHGLSTGKLGAIDNFDEYVQSLDGLISLVTNPFDHPLTLIAQSTGAAITMAWLEKRQKQDRPAIPSYLLAPLVQPSGWRNINLLFKLLSPILNQYPRKFMVCSHDQQFLDYIDKVDPLQFRYIPLSWIAALIEWRNKFANGPVIDAEPVVIQGGLDDTVDWPANLSIIDKRFKQATFHLLPNAMHHLINEEEKLRNQLFRILSAYLS